MPVEERLALLGAADVFWVSSVRDGLNRWPLEYVAVQYDAVVAGGFDHAPENKQYFDAILERAADCCGGAGYPCGDPCTDFVPKGPHSKRGDAAAERRALAAEVFPESDGASLQRRAKLEARTPGTLVLSDSSSARRRCWDADGRKPWRVDDGATALRRAGHAAAGRLARLAKDAVFRKSHDGKWAYRVLADLKTVPRAGTRCARRTRAGAGLPDPGHEVGLRRLAGGSRRARVPPGGPGRAERGADGEGRLLGERGRLELLYWTMVARWSRKRRPSARSRRTRSRAAPKDAAALGRGAGGPGGARAGPAERGPRRVGARARHALDGLAGPGLADLGLAAGTASSCGGPPSIKRCGPGDGGDEHGAGAARRRGHGVARRARPAAAAAGDVARRGRRASTTATGTAPRRAAAAGAPRPSRPWTCSRGRRRAPTPSATSRVWCGNIGTRTRTSTRCRRRSSRASCAWSWRPTAR